MNEWKKVISAQNEKLQRAVTLFAESLPIANENLLSVIIFVAAFSHQIHGFPITLLHVHRI